MEGLPEQSQGVSGQPAPVKSEPKQQVLKVSEALSLSPESPAKVKGLVKPVGEFSSDGLGWLAVKDTTDTIYAWGPRFEGNAIVSGTIKESQGTHYISIERLKKVRPESLLLKIAPFVIIALIPVILYFGVTLSIPDFHIADIIGPKEPPIGLSDLKKDKLSGYRLEAIWHEGPILCAEIRNTGKIVVPKDDLDLITFSIDNSSIYWNRSTLPEKLMLGKRLDMCLCADAGEGCPDGKVFYRYERVGETYPNVAIEIRPWFGSVETKLK